MDHGLEAHVSLSAADDLGDILVRKISELLFRGRLSTYAWVVGLKKSDLDAFLLEKALGLSKVQRSVVRRGVPAIPVSPSSGICQFTLPYQLVRNVILSVDIVDDTDQVNTASVNTRRPLDDEGRGGYQRSMSFRWYYPDQVHRYFSDQLLFCHRSPALLNLLPSQARSDEGQ